ncbi:PREDICTED: late embryogenesis abundant protein 50-like [Tarenaya hassleriana]|uniref:late embryogenesis abundant protein 50-like n=1 Tax=Tarenaya hassleriana TaxID=28532 RepID=UPI00053C5B3A|nr:PREDICTED: late embryogenesis abundant protein 50-like [Tarenaya hassleriana]
MEWSKSETVEKSVSGSPTESGARIRRQAVESVTSFGGQFMGPVEQMSSAAKALVGRSTTLTEALKAASMRVGRKPVEASDAAAIKVVESLATGTQPEAAGGISAVAEDAASRNMKVGVGDEVGGITLSDIIADVDNKLERDRSVTSEDAEAVVAAELRHHPGSSTTPGGIAESVVAACKLNRNPYF